MATINHSSAQLKLDLENIHLLKPLILANARAVYKEAYPDDEFDVITLRREVPDEPLTFEARVIRYTTEMSTMMQEVLVTSQPSKTTIEAMMDLHLKMQRELGWRNW